MELKSRNVQHSRNLFDRAVTLLPRIDQLWYKYVYLEELLGNVAGARQVFERWMTWEPDDKAWSAYIKMEERYGEQDRASAIYERWIAVRPEPRVWVKWAKFEEERGRDDKARQVFQTALEFFGDEEQQIKRAQAVFNAFAKMETRFKEYERARVIYKVGIADQYSHYFSSTEYHFSSLWIASRAPSPLPSTMRTQNSRNNTARRQPSPRQSLAKDASSTKKS
jgi:crooked neck